MSMRDHLIHYYGYDNKPWCEQPDEQKFYDIAANIAEREYLRGRDLATSMEAGIEWASMIAVIKSCISSVQSRP